MTRLKGSVGVLSTRRDYTTNRQNSVPLCTGSITTRSQANVSQSQKRQGNYYAQEPHIKITRTERIFQFDTKPLIKNETSIPNSTVKGQRGNKKGSDYVSVKAIIKQWPGSDAKKKTQSPTFDEEKYKNSRSPPTNLKANDSLSERVKSPLTKSVAQTMHYKSQKGYMSKSDWALDVGSERNHSLSDRKQYCSVENRVRRKSEPSALPNRDYDPAIVPRNRASSMKYSDEFKNNNKVRINTLKISETRQDSQNSFSHTPQKKNAKGLKSKNHSEHHKTCRNLPIQISEVKQVENYVDQKYYQPTTGTSTGRRQLESIGKHATMQARHRKPSHRTFIRRNEREQTSLDEMKWKSEEDYDHLSKYSSDRSSSSSRPLPDYKEAMAPLRDENLIEAVKTRRIDNKKEIDKDYVSVERLHQKRTRDKANLSKMYDCLPQKQPVTETIGKKNITHIEASETGHPIIISKDENNEMKSKHRYSQKRSKDFASQKQNVTRFDVRRSLVKKTSDQHVNGVNNNQLPAYDGEVLKSLLISQQQNTRNDFNGSRFIKESGKTENWSSNKNAKPRNQNNAYLNEYEQLREAQITSLDADFENRTRMNLVTDVTGKGKVAFSNVVHEGELLQLLVEEEKYWKDKIDEKDKLEQKEAPTKHDEAKKAGIDKQERAKDMLLEVQMHDQKEKNSSGITDTLRAEEEFLAQEAEKLLKQRFRENKAKAMKPVLASEFHSIPHLNASDRLKNTSAVDESSSGLHSILKISRPKHSPPSIMSCDDFNLKPKADQTFQQNHSKRILWPKSPVYICNGCLLPAQRDICFYVAELQSYWHKKCFRCSVCYSSLIQTEETPKIRVMYSRIYCENCLSSKRTGQSTMV